MAEAISQTETAATGSSVRAALAATVAISAFTLSIATFELAMADWPSGFILLGVVPLVALLFFGCIVWSATLLLKVRSGGAKFALPFLICALTLAVLAYTPLHQIALQQNFRWHREDRQRIVARVEAGDRKSTRLNSSHLGISYAVFCLKKKKHTHAVPYEPRQGPAVLQDAVSQQRHPHLGRAGELRPHHEPYDAGAYQAADLIAKCGGA